MASDAASSETTATVLRATAGQVRLQLEGGREVTKRVTVPISKRETLVGQSVPIVVTGEGDKARVDLADNWLDAGATPAKKAPAKRKRTGGAVAAEAETAEVTPAKKPAAKRRRSGGADPVEAAPAEAPKKPAARKPRAKKAAPAEAPVVAAAEAETAAAPAKRTRTRAAKKPVEPEVVVAEEAPAEVVAAPVVAEEAPAEATVPVEAPSVAEEPKPKRSRSRSRGGRGKKADAPAAEAVPVEAATGESPTKADTPVVEAPAVVALDPEVLRTRIAAAVDLVRAARAA